MFFVYLDEFGHIGPFVNRRDGRHNASPVFGIAGIVLPENRIRQFSSSFLHLKSVVFAEDIRRANRPSFQWEKKGSDIFRPKAIENYPSLRSAGFRLINMLHNNGGSIFYHGREKTVSKLDGNPVGLYTTVLSHTIRQLDSHCEACGNNYVLVLDQHDARRELLDCASKTMYGREPARRLLSPPFEVESHLNQPIQAADWIAAIVGRLWAFEVQSGQYADHEKFHRYYWQRIHQHAIYSSLRKRPLPRTRPRIFPKQIIETALGQALAKSGLAAMFPHLDPDKS